MKLVQKFKVKKFKDRTSRVVIDEYPLESEIANLAVAHIKGSYPVSGYAVNEESIEIVYCVKGKGSCFTREKKTNFKAGDGLIINAGEVFRWEGVCDLAMVNSPAWKAEQHRFVKK